MGGLILLGLLCSCIGSLNEYSLRKKRLGVYLITFLFPGLSSRSFIYLGLNLTVLRLTDITPQRVSRVGRGVQCIVVRSYAKRMMIINV
ncbi:hypothetical protein BGW36DRAFT_389768 [Talaromyces proteolyticus]|uniref:Uncharacterized protein n=1 Tax=Talaromyces proteolyticus TaxID=1131652 RepID=A0AAD4PRT8_9EURO|nr:uncharacterized protein BGW36DRAFT_389768 [Talaromyces proteolyticus]KAH8689800.1 hypothetical protein BGW36DRAFT_389768 [Talaromyces proteolyticus]